MTRDTDTPTPRPRRVIVIAERVDDVVIVTPRNRNAQLGLTAARIVVAPSMQGHAAVGRLVADCLPCMATTPLLEVTGRV